MGKPHYIANAAGDSVAIPGSRLLGWSLQDKSGSGATFELRDGSIDTPGAVTAALKTPAAAGNVDDGAHDYGVTFVNASGETIASAVVIVTVADKTVNGQVSLSAIPLGPTGTTMRKLYRSAAAAHQLKLLATLADNTTTVYTDNVADGSLGANAPANNSTGALITHRVLGNNGEDEFNEPTDLQNGGDQKGLRLEVISGTSLSGEVITDIVS